MEFDAGAARALDEPECLAAGHLERRLRGSVANLAAYGDAGGVDIQTEFDLTISLVETSDERFLRAVALDIPPVFGSI